MNIVGSVGREVSRIEQRFAGRNCMKLGSGNSLDYERNHGIVWAVH